MKPIRVLALLEATSVTGPAKNLLQFAEMARSASVDPLEIEIATFARPGDPITFLDAAEHARVPVHSLPQSGPLDLSVIPALVALNKEVRPDVVQTHAVKSHFLLRRSGLHRELPWVAFHHGYTWPSLRARIYNHLDRWSLREARQVVTVSAPFRDELIANGVLSTKIRVIHNAIRQGWGTRSQDEAATIRSRLGIATDTPVLLIVGRLSREKDHATLLDAQAVLRTQSVPTHVLMVGDGPERTRLQEKIRTLDLGSHVTMVGQVASAEPYYGLSDIAVLSSLSEGSPNALLEAMSSGVPVVATRVGGIPEIVADGDSALLVAPRDVTGMADALMRLLKDSALADSLSGRAKQLVLERHSPEVRYQALRRMYAELS